MELRVVSAPIICFASGKGGSGKTSISTAFARVLAHFGKRVLLVDADAATNGLSLLHLSDVLTARSAPEKSTARGFLEERGTSSLLVCETQFGPSLIPASAEPMDTSTFPVEAFRRNLDTLVDEFGLSFDFVVLDAQAGTDELAQEAAICADHVVLVSEYDPISMKGIDRLKLILSSRLSTERIWILFNKLLPEFSDQIGDFLSIAKFLPPVPWDADVVRAFARGELALDLESGNVYTQSIMHIVSTLLPGEMAESVEEWTTLTRESLLSPKRSALLSVEASIQAAEALLETHRRRREFTGFVLSALRNIAFATVIAIPLLMLLVPDSTINILGPFGDSIPWLYFAVMTPILGGFFVFWRRHAAIESEYGLQALQIERRIKELSEQKQLIRAELGTAVSGDFV